MKSDYSRSYNTISDLGNTVCGMHAGGYVCSPLHTLMNAGFVALGLIIISGAITLYPRWHEEGGKLTLLLLFALSGIGTILVGIFPENSIGYIHNYGAALASLAGNTALIIFVMELRLGAFFRHYTLSTAIVSSAASFLILSNHYGLIGIGGMERFASYPYTLWFLVYAVYALQSHLVCSKHI